jgi:D-hexose-6-phosphate mutarotase
MAKGKTDPQTAANPGRVTFLDGRGDLPMVEIATALSTAEIYLQGAHVTHFKKKDEPPLLFLSQCSRFSEGQAIRGGIPVIFPWFGAREGMGQHGFARVKAWDLKEFIPSADGSVSVRFCLPEYPEAATLPPLSLDYVVTVSGVLDLELITTNRSDGETLEFENCLHTYFSVSNIAEVSIEGLSGVTYLDKVQNFAQKTETADAIRINSEVDRIYLNTRAPVEILDRRGARKIRIETQGANSTVVWNPWIAKAQQLPDFGGEEYQQMVCVESGNVASNSIKLAPGETSALKVTLSSEPLG